MVSWGFYNRICDFLSSIYDNHFDYYYYYTERRQMFNQWRLHPRPYNLPASKDYEDGYEKLVFGLKYGLFCSIPFATVAYQNAKRGKMSTNACRLRALKASLKTSATAGFYCGSVYIFGYLRNEDSYLNHFYSGVATGSLYARTLSRQLAPYYNYTVIILVFCGLLGVYIKSYRDYDFEKAVRCFEYSSHWRESPVNLGSLDEIRAKEALLEKKVKEMNQMNSKEFIELGYAEKVDKIKQN